MISNNRKTVKMNCGRHVKFLLNTCSTIVINVVLSGASRQDNEKKASNTTTNTMSYVENKITTSCTTF